ncbi:MAG: alpha/beta fold hydrolase [Pseudomonadota bacterium]
MPTVDLATGTLHFRRAGAGSPLLLLHANPGDSRDYEAVFTALAAHFDVIAPDWPGYGASAPLAGEAASAMALHRTLTGFLDALGLERVALIGNSVGGYAAARLAIEQPQRVSKLVLVSPGGFTPHNTLTRLFCRWQGSPAGLPPALMARLYLHRHTPVADAMRARATAEQSAPAARQLNRAIWRSFMAGEHDLRAAARTIRCPTLLVFGSFDPLIPFWRDGRAARRALPHAHYLRFATGHAPFAEAPDEFLAGVLPFLRG